MVETSIQGIKSNIKESYSYNIGFPVYTAQELKHIYMKFGVDPKGTDRRIFDLESLSHHNQKEVVRLFQVMKIQESDKVLDVGCGNGAPSRLMAKLHGCRITGVDLTPAQIEKAKKCNELEGVDHLIETFVSDVLDLEFEEQSFDKVFHNETMCHWNNKNIALEKLYRFLKKGGTMGFHDWVRGDEGSLNEARGDFPGTYGENVWFQNTLEENLRLLEDAGFKVLHAEDLTDRIDRSLRARLKELEISKVYTQAASEEYRQKSLRYFQIMIETNYKYLRYGRFVCIKDKV